MTPRESLQAAIKRILAAARKAPEIEVTVQRQDLEILLGVVMTALNKPRP